MSQTKHLITILVDDLGWKDLSCTGSEFYETPNIDRLATGGMRFEQAYASCPVCSPTRASLLTGKYPARLGLTQYIGGKNRGRLEDVPYVDHLDPTEHNLAKALGQAGYQRWHVGKWHLGGEDYWPDKQGFDVNIAGNHAGGPFRGGCYFSPWNLENLENGPEGEFLTDRLGEEACKLIRERDHEKPFFLNLSFYAVHTPIMGKPEKVAKYVRKAKELGIDRIQPFHEGEYFACEHKRHQRIRRRVIQSDPIYAALIESLDENVGRVLDQLEAEGILDETLIVFTSDNGGLATSEGSPTSNHPLAEGKGWMYEGGTRVAFLAHQPGRIPAGTTCQTPITSTDLYPTYLEACGLPLQPEQHCDGVSLLPLLEREAPIERDTLYWHYPHYSNQGESPGSSLRDGRYKLIEYFEDGHLELYDLENDPGETVNLAETQAELCQQLHAKLQVWRESIEAAIPEQSADYDPMLYPRSQDDRRWNPYD